jgi:hypothetical protein
MSTRTLAILDAQESKTRTYREMIELAKVGQDRTPKFRRLASTLDRGNDTLIRLNAGPNN